VFYNRLLSGLMAATMLCAGTQAVAAPPPPPAAAAPDQNVALERANAVIEAMNEVGDAFKMVDRNAIQAGKTLQEKASILDAQLVQAQRSVDQGSRKLNAMEPLAGDDDLTKTVNQVLKDGKLYGQRIQAIVGDMREVSLAMKSGDQPRLQKSLVSMSAGMVAMLEGQAIIYRSRKVFVDKGSSDAYQLDASAFLYEGMAAMAKAALRLTPPTQAVQPVRTARDSARAAVATGRARLQVELTGTSGLSAGERKTLASNGALQAQIFDSMDKSAAILSRASDRLEAGDLSQLQADVAALGAEEDLQQQLTVQQFNAT
jgi:hypothetical protein